MNRSRVMSAGRMGEVIVKKSTNKAAAVTPSAAKIEWSERPSISRSQLLLVHLAHTGQYDPIFPPRLHALQRLG
jgi:hypothetical protein